MRKLLQIIVGKITGKTCSNCKHCFGIVCVNSSERHDACVSSIFPKGFEPKERERG